jgi:hypothetical protein
MTGDRSRRGSRRWMAVAAALLLAPLAGMGAAAPVFTHPLSATDFDGTAGWNTSGAWSVAKLAWELVRALPSGVSLANITNLSPTVLLTAVGSWQLPGNLSQNATVALEWTVTLSASAPTNTTFVVHFRASGVPFSPVAGSAYFLLPLGGIGPWTLHLYAPLGAASPPPSLTSSLIGVFACASGGICP